jgi:DNA polymerase/3'-5' exonuclease PolX
MPSQTGAPTSERVPLARATELADELVDLLGSSCEQIHVCGSIRRQAPTVGDIDIVAVPKLAPVHDMFGTPTGNLNVLNYRLDDLCGEQVIRQGRRADGRLAGWGPRLRCAVYGGLRVQVQSVEADCLGMWLVIRTGPADYSHAFVTPSGTHCAIRDKHGVVTDYRPGLLPPGFSVERSPELGGFRLHRAYLFVPTPTEASVYEALGREYLPPEKRKSSTP